MINNLVSLFNNNIWLLIYLISINILTFIIYGLDKLLAIFKTSRISEKTLIVLSIIGGSLGAIIGMFIFHHKTLKPLFRIGLPMIFIIQIIIVIIVSNI